MAFSHKTIQSHIPDVGFLYSYYQPMSQNLTTSWDLPRYYYQSLEDPKFLADFASILPAIQELRAKYKPILKDFTSPEEMLAFYEENEALSLTVNKVALYLFYLESLDTQNSAIKKKQ